MFRKQLIGGSKMAAGSTKWPPAAFSRPALAYRAAKMVAGWRIPRIAVSLSPIMRLMRSYGIPPLHSDESG